MTYSYKKFNEDLSVDQILFDECRDNKIKQREINDEAIDSIALHALTDFIAKN